MKVEQVRAFKSEDGCIWEKEEDAIDQNINDCFDKAGVNHDDGFTTIRLKIKTWMKDHPKDVKYILANIHKIDIE